jgi:2-amino-4-hydroxy-6-hydroxymethyldihydropteridine diphosphokinase
MGDQIWQLNRARRYLAGNGINMLQASSIYRSAAWGPIQQDDFANQVVRVAYNGSPQSLLQLILNIEETMGRKREVKWGPRIIDIDILYFGDMIIDEPGLQVPHPEIANRRFTLAPLSELAPDFKHPVSKKKQALLLAQCPDSLSVERWL